MSKKNPLQVPMLGGLPNQAMMIQAFEGAHRDLVQRALQNGVPAVVAGNIVVLNGLSLLIQGNFAMMSAQANDIEEAAAKAAATEKDKPPPAAEEPAPAPGVTASGIVVP